MPKGIYNRTKEQYLKIGLSNKGKKRTQEVKDKIKNNNSKYWAGKKLSDEHKLKLSESHKGYKMPEAQKRKLSLANSIPRPWSQGELSPNWKGGKSFEIYPVDWTQTLKRSIRERDKYVCQMCGEQQGDVTHAVHHIDYNKKNCNPDNLITLCKSCHSITNGNREYWKRYFLGDEEEEIDDYKKDNEIGFNVS